MPNIRGCLTVVWGSYLNSYHYDNCIKLLLKCFDGHVYIIVFWLFCHPIWRPIKSTNQSPFRWPRAKRALLFDPVFFHSTVGLSGDELLSTGGLSSPPCIDTHQWRRSEPPTIYYRIWLAVAGSKEAVDPSWYPAAFFGIGTIWYNNSVVEPEPMS
jgi:hypothetical protein